MITRLWRGRAETTAIAVPGCCGARSTAGRNSSPRRSGNHANRSRPLPAPTSPRPSSNPKRAPCWPSSTNSRATTRWRSRLTKDSRRTAGLQARGPARLLAAQDRRAGIARLGAELLLDAQELVVLGEPVRARQRAGLDLAAVGGDRQVGNRGVLGLAGTVGHHGAVGSVARHRHGFHGLAERADLVDLDQNGVGQPVPDAD